MKPLDEMRHMMARVEAAKKDPRPHMIRIHPLDLAKIPRDTGISVLNPMSINMLTGVPCQPDCGVRRGHPEIDYRDEHGNTVTVTS